MDCIEVKIGSDDIMLMGGDVCGDCKIDYLRSMEFYALTMNNCGKVRKGSIGLLTRFSHSFRKSKRPVLF